MTSLGVASRWIVAIPLFASSWLIGLTVGAMAIKALGGSLPYSNMAGISCATICGALVGILTAPRQHRLLATHLFVGGAVALVLYSAVRHYLSGDFAPREQLALLGAIGGGAVVYAAIGRAYLNHEHAGSREAATAQVAIRWVVALLMAPLTFFTIYVLVLFWDHWLGGIGPYQSICAVILATVAGVTVGVMVVPAQHRARGFWLFVGAANMMPLAGILIAAARGQLQA